MHTSCTRVTSTLAEGFCGAPTHIGEMCTCVKARALAFACLHMHHAHVHGACMHHGHQSPGHVHVTSTLADCCCGASVHIGDMCPRTSARARLFACVYTQHAHAACSRCGQQGSHLVHMPSTHLRWANPPADMVCGAFMHIGGVRTCTAASCSFACTSACIQSRCPPHTASGITRTIGMMNAH